MPAAEVKNYRYVGDHGIELEVGDTRPQLGFGDFIELSADDIKVDSTKDLISDGLLIPIDKMPAAKVAEVKALEESEGGK